MSLHECIDCHREMPISWFPNPAKRMACRACITGERTDEVSEAIDAKTKELSKKFSELTATDVQAESARVKNVLSEVYENFGGAAGFAEQLHWTIQKLCERKQVPASAAGMMLQILKLHHQVEQSEEAIDARRMTDDQLKREQEMAMMKLTLEAVGDKDKFQALQDLLGPRGFKIIETEAHETLHSMAEKGGLITAKKEEETHGGD